jgi:predicted Zn-ribbon and HTH transcriptional regulator
MENCSGQKTNAEQIGELNDHGISKHDLNEKNKEFIKFMDSDYVTNKVRVIHNKKYIKDKGITTILFYTLCRECGEIDRDETTELEEKVQCRRCGCWDHTKHFPDIQESDNYKCFSCR